MIVPFKLTKKMIDSKIVSMRKIDKKKFPVKLDMFWQDFEISESDVLVL